MKTTKLLTLFLFSILFISSVSANIPIFPKYTPNTNVYFEFNFTDSSNNVLLTNSSVIHIDDSGVGFTNIDVNSLTQVPKKLFVYRDHNILFSESNFSDLIFNSIRVNDLRVEGLANFSGIPYYNNNTPLSALNETNLINSVNTTNNIQNLIDNYSISRNGNCPSGYIVQNTTSLGVQCVIDSVFNVSGDVVLYNLNVTQNVSASNFFGFLNWSWLQNVFNFTQQTFDTYNSTWDNNWQIAMLSQNVSSINKTANIQTLVNGTYVPYNGASQNVNLGIYNLTGGSLNFSNWIYILNSSQPNTLTNYLSIHNSLNQGIPRLEADSQFTSNGCDVVNRDNCVIVKNIDGTSLTIGTPVYVNGAQGANPTIIKANANSTTTIPVLGLVVNNTLVNNGFGYVMTKGILSNVDTSPWPAGTILFVNYTTAGTLTNVRPPYPYYANRVGTVMVSNAINGQILVEVAPFVGGMESGTTNTNYTFAGTVTAQNLNVTNMISYNGNIPITALNNTNYLLNSAPWNQSGSNVFLNNPGNNVGIGTSSPTTQLEINITQGQTTPALQLTQTGSTGYSIMQLDRQNNARSSAIYFSTSGTPDWYMGTLYNGGSANSGWSLSTTSNSIANSKLFVATGGNVGIGTNNPLYTLDVNAGIVNHGWIQVVGNQSGIIFNATDGGSSKRWDINNILGNLYFDETGIATRLVIQNTTGNVGIGTTNPSQALEVNGSMRINNPAGTIGGLIIGNSTGVTAQSVGTEGLQVAYNFTSHNITFSNVYWGTSFEPFVFKGKDFQFQTGTGSVTDALFIKSTGFVGIGTTSPNNPLDISSATAGNIQAIHTAAGQAADNAFTAYGSGRAQVGYDGGYFGLRLAVSDASKPIVFANNLTGGAAEYARFDGVGKFGIGTSVPNSLLHLNGTGVTPLILQRTSQNVNMAFNNTAKQLFVGMNPAGDFGVGSTNDLTSAPFIINVTNGNVGIGTTSPATTLSVIGNVSFTMIAGTNFTAGALFVNGSNVGIGTTSPSQPLEVNGKTRMGQWLEFYNGSSIQGYIGYGSAGSLFTDGLADGLDIRGTNSVQLGVGTGSDMTILSSGNVGIGTTSPSFQLSLGDGTNSNSLIWINRLQTSSNLDLYSFYNSSKNYAGYGVQPSSGLFRIWSNASGLGNLFSLNLTTGNVGIGTTSPTGLLQVSRGAGQDVFADWASPYFGVSISAYTSGTWARSYNFFNESSGSILGGFGAYGRANVVDYYYIGAAYNSAIAVFNQTSGNVGIGTINPVGNLDVYGTNGARIRAIDNRSAGFGSLETYSDNTAMFEARTYGSGVLSSVFGVTLANYSGLFTVGADSNGLLIGTITAKPIIFGTNNAEAMRILSGGNVGIGTTAPNSLLDINSSGNLNLISAVNISGRLANEAGSGLSVVPNLQPSTSAKNIMYGAIINPTTTNNLAGVDATNQIALYLGMTGNSDATNTYALYANASATAGTNKYAGVFMGGNVGIETASPIGSLDINGSSIATTISSISNPTLALRQGNTTLGILNTIMFLNTGGFGSAAISMNQSSNGNNGSNLILQTKDASDSNWNDAQLVLNPNGNVGIGTSAPGSPLTISSTLSQTNLSLQSSGTTDFIIGGSAANNYFDSLRSDDLYFKSNSVIKMTMQANTGNLGIGTTNPRTKLEVNGEIYANGGGFNLNGTIAGTGYSLTNTSNVLRWVIRAATAEGGSNTGYDLAFNARDDAGNQLGQVLTLQRTGDVGIGTGTPSNTLDVRGVGNFSGVLYYNNQTPITALNDTLLILNSAAWNMSGANVFLNNPGDSVGIGTSNPDSLLTIAKSAKALNVSGMLYVNSTNVGIGTSSPQALLHLQTLAGALVSNYPIIRYNNSITSWDAGVGATGDTNLAGKFYLGISGAGGSLVISNGTGNVGIGTQTPTAPLNVVGDTNVTGNVLMGYEIVSNSCSSVTTCSVSCPSGKKILGGGCQVNIYSPYNNYPLNSTTWSCATTSSATMVAVGICARIGN